MGESKGNAVTLAPRLTRLRRMFSLTPQSMTATCAVGSGALTWKGALVLTFRTRLICSGSTNASSSSASYSSPTVILASDEPCSRRYVTIALVSTPDIAGTPSLAHHSLKLSTAVQWLYRSAKSATTTPTAWMFGDSKYLSRPVSSRSDDGTP